MIGDPHRASELLQDRIALSKHLGTTTLLACGKGLLAMCLLTLRERDVIPLCHEAIQLAKDTHDQFANALAHRTLAEALGTLVPPDISRAKEAVLEAIRMQEESGSMPELARSHVTYARLLHMSEVEDEARRYLAKALDMFQQMGMVDELRRAEETAGGLSWT